MKHKNIMSSTLFGAAATVAVMGITTTVAMAKEPCDDFGECKVIIEINATDGDIGFHFLVDGDDLVKVEVRNPDGKKIFKADAKKELREQFMTETFVESAEPLCWDTGDPEDDVEDIVTLEEFLERWTPGTYVFKGKGDEGEKLTGETELTYLIPAAPSGLGFDGTKISWAVGVDLGNCATEAELDDLVTDGVLPTHPKGVTVDAWEVVFEPDVDDGDPLGQLKFTIRVAGDIGTKAVTVPPEYLADLPDDTLAKIEVGAIGGEDNATFTELFDICVNEVEGCGGDDD